MDNVTYFDNDNQTKDFCTGTAYYDFLDYAFNCINGVC